MSFSRLGSLGFGFGRLGAPAIVTAVSEYIFTNAEAETYAAAMTTEPNDTRKGVIDTLFSSLKLGATSGTNLYADRIDRIGLTAAHAEQAGRLELKTATEITPFNSPAFQADRGFTGNGTSAYFDLGYNPSTAGGLMTQDSAHIGVYVTANSANTSPDIGCANSLLRARVRGGVNTNVRVTCGTALAALGAFTFPEHFCGIRRASGTQLLFKAGASENSAANASTGMPDSMYLLRDGTAYTDRQVMAWHFGSQLSDAEAFDLYTAINVYMVAVGADT